MLAHILALAVGIGSVALYIAAFFFPEIHRKNDFIWSGIGLFYGLTLWVFAPRVTGGLFLGNLASVALLGYFGWQTVQLRRQVTPQALQTPVPSNPVQNVQGTEEIEEQIENKSVISKLTQPLQGLMGIFAGGKTKTQSTSTMAPTTVPATAATTAVTTAKNTDSTSEGISLNKAAIDAITEADTTTASQSPSEEVVSSEEEEINLEAIPEATISQVEVEVEETQTPEIPQAIPPESPSEELVEAAQTDETEEKTIPPVEEIAPDAQLAPPAQTTTESTVEKKLNEGQE